LLASMDRNRIAQTVLIGAPPVASNEWLLTEAMRQAPGRLVPVATLPALPEQSSLDAWTSAYEELAQKGARGFKIHSNLDGLPADHPAYAALFDVAQQHKLFVILHTGCFKVLGFKKPGPVDIPSYEPLFKRHPEVPVCLAHMNRREPEGAWTAMKRHGQ